MHASRFRLFVLLMFLTVSLVLAGDTNDAGFWSDLPDDILIETMLAEMSPEEKLGQIFLLGYPDSRPSTEFLEWITERNIGGIKIFGWNARDLSVMTESIALMQNLALESDNAVPLLVTTDQEGGWVRHVKGETSITPGNMAIGATGLAADAYETGRLIGNELKVLGINMNFAPAVDLFTNPDAEVVGPRAFSQDPIQTAVLSVAYYRGLEDAGVIATAKHYPGHGNASEDSHGSLPVIMDDEETIWNRELVPYRFLIRENLPAIMSGHLAYPSILGEELPATLSHYFLTTLLREKMGFEGVVVTDELRMWGIRKSEKSMPEICYDAIMAGNDLLLISWEAGLNEAIWEYLTEAIAVDPQLQRRIDESVGRILKVKLRYLKNGYPLIPDPDKAAAQLPWNDEGFLFEQACRSVTLLRNARIPYEPTEGERILLAGQIKAFFDAGRAMHPGADIFDFDYYRQPTKTERIEFLRLAAQYDTVIYCLATRPAITMLQELQSLRERVIVISALSPVYLDEAGWLNSALAVYGSGYDSFYAGFAALRGDFTPEGTLPIDLENPSWDGN